jgi:hypothetical protein
LIRSWVESTVYSTRGEHANHSTTDAVQWLESTVYSTRGAHANQSTTDGVQRLESTVPNQQSERFLFCLSLLCGLNLIGGALVTMLASSAVDSGFEPLNRIGGALVSMLASSAVDSGFEPLNRIGGAREDNLSK